MSLTLPPGFESLAGFGEWALSTERERFGLPPVSEQLGLRTPEPSLEDGCMSCSIETACPGGHDALAVRSASD